MGVPQWFDARPVLYLADYSHHLNLGFCRGAFLADPRGLLEGSGKGLRHVKVRTVEQARSPDLAALIRRAAAAGSGVVG